MVVWIGRARRTVPRGDVTVATTVDESSNRRPPRRVLIVSADMGAGHDATGRALRAAASRLWPEVDVRWADMLELMGRGVGPLFRGVYETSVRSLPGLYEYFYGSVWRHRWFAHAAKRVIGAWTGRRLAGAIDRIGPDLIISTYPMASSGLEWLRRHRGLSVPTGAWISDFAPHPSWVHADVDLNLVMHEVAVPAAQAAVRGAAVAVSAPPVPEAFQPGDRDAARVRLALPPTGVVALVSCGSLGFGHSGESVAELLDGVPDATVVVVAGRNERLRRELDTRFANDARVRVLGWTDQMADLMTAADVVVTNAGGATSLEALACGRAVLMHRPIAGHGRANANLMAHAGLAEVCTEPGSLTAAFRRLCTDPAALAKTERAARGHVRAHRLEDGLNLLAGTAPEPARRLRSGDALFLHVDSAAVPQYVGTALVFDPGPEELSARHVAGLVAGIPGATGVLRTGTRGTRWLPTDVQPRDLVEVVDAGGEPIHVATMDEFFAIPLDPARRLCAVRLVTGLPDGGCLMLVKLHHALSDGIAVLRALLADTDGATGKVWSNRPHVPVAADHGDGDPGQVLRGLWRLARAGRAPKSPLDGRIAHSGRHHELVLFPAARLRALSRALGLSSGELVPALFAEGLNHALRPEKDSLFRLMVPWSVRGTGTTNLAGNQTGAVPVDLPVGPMPAGTRARLVARALRAQTGAGVPEAAHAVVRALGVVPPWLRPLAARGVYDSRWFNGIGTVLPGPRREIRWHGALLTAAYPVLALAPGTGVAWGAMTWGHSVTMCLTTTAELSPLAARLADGIRTAFDRLSERAGGGV